MIRKHISLTDVTSQTASSLSVSNHESSLLSLLIRKTHFFPTETRFSARSSLCPDIEFSRNDFGVSEMWKVCIGPTTEKIRKDGDTSRARPSNPQTGCGAGGAPLFFSMSVYI